MLAKKVDYFGRKVTKERGTHESRAGGSVAGRRSCPVQTANDEEDHADEGLARIDDNATTKFVSGEGPDRDSEEVAAAEKG
jgi:hypothetical protein